jgi:hypothetical protein
VLMAASVTRAIAPSVPKFLSEASRAAGHRDGSARYASSRGKRTNPLR